MSRRHRSKRIAASLSALAATALFVAAVPATAHDGESHPDEAAALGTGHAQEHAKIRAAAQALGGYSQLARIESLSDLTRSQELANSKFHPKAYGQFAE